MASARQLRLLRSPAWSLHRPTPRAAGLPAARKPRAVRPVPRRTPGSRATPPARPRSPRTARTRGISSGTTASRTSIIERPPGSLARTDRGRDGAFAPSRECCRSVLFPFLPGLLVLRLGGLPHPHAEEDAADREADQAEREVHRQPVPALQGRHRHRPPDPGEYA